MTKTIAIEVQTTPAQRPSPEERALLDSLRDAGFGQVADAEIRRRFFLSGDLSSQQVEEASRLLFDPVIERSVLLTEQPPRPDPSGREFEIHPRPGVMDPVALSVAAELQAEGIPVESVRTARRFLLSGDADPARLGHFIRGRLANDCVEAIHHGTLGVQPPMTPPNRPSDLRTVALRDMRDADLSTLSRQGGLFLSLAEMQTIQAHFRAMGRDPTDLELETLAQTWSEHCVHKTLKSAVRYRGAAFPRQANAKSPAVTDASRDEVEVRYENLLKDTIARATHELMEAGRGPECLSVFKDNAGIIGFDDQYGISFKVETHNHPSAIEPYGGAATGLGGCIRDVLGSGLGARPIANTDVFCVAPPDFPEDRLPRGVLPPRFVLRNIVQGVADYGNRMGVPTVNGALEFDVRYLGNPLVFCGCVGLIPRDRIEKSVRPGDFIVLAGGRTGRDGIHGATFSSAEMTDTHVDEFAHAVQIGNAIEEKRLLDGVLRARDHRDGCLYTAITDCGAGGLSSAIGEMGAQLGARVDLEKVPLKYAGLRYDEIWISEAQERMVLAVPKENWPAFAECMRIEEVEATPIGVFGEADAAGDPRLLVRFNGQTVGELSMHFLHEGLPKTERIAEWRPPVASVRAQAQQGHSASPLEELRERLARPVTAAKKWIVRRYDHEVQGGTVIKPFMGPGSGPSDAAVLHPAPQHSGGIAIGCGLCPRLSDIDPYWMASAAIDEALRNIVCVGGDPRRTAILDNFCWGGCDDPQQMGALVRACQACYDAAIAYGTPFISGKDSLNNQLALNPDAIETLIAAFEQMARGDSVDQRELAAMLPSLVASLRRTGRLAIPATLLISAVSIIDNVARACTSDLKARAGSVWLVGGMPATSFDFQSATRTHFAVADWIAAGEVRACHDVSDGGWLTCLAEMAIGGGIGVRLLPNPEVASLPAPFDDLAAAYIVQGRDDERLQANAARAGVRALRLAELDATQAVQWGNQSASLETLEQAWCSLAR